MSAFAGQFMRPVWTSAMNAIKIHNTFAMNDFVFTQETNQP